MCDDVNTKTVRARGWEVDHIFQDLFIERTIYMGNKDITGGSVRETMRRARSGERGLSSWGIITSLDLRPTATTSSRTTATTSSSRTVIMHRK